MASGASAETSLATVGTAKTEAKSLSVAREAHPRPGELSTVVADAEARAANLLGSRKVVKPHTWPVCAKIVKVGSGERKPTPGITFGAGH